MKTKLEAEIASFSQVQMPDDMMVINCLIYLAYFVIFGVSLLIWFFWRKKDDKI